MDNYTLKSVAHKHLGKFKNFRDTGIYSEADVANAFNNCLNEMHRKYNTLIVSEDMTRSTGRRTYFIGANVDATGSLIFIYTHM